MKRLLLIALVLCFTLQTVPALAEGDDQSPEEKGIKIPDSVMTIAKENTYPNPAQDLPRLQPSELAQQLLDSTDVPIENPELIRMFNESTFSSSPLALAFRASIYLGEWPLYYESSETHVNWEYQRVNKNVLDNRGGKSVKTLTYNQEEQKKVTGGLTAQIPKSDAVMKMMMIKAAENTGLPLAFETIIGEGTKKAQTYNIQPKHIGYLHSHVPAANEKGKVTYGEVYLTFRAGKPKLEIKNVTQQGIGAWIPVQDHLSFTFLSGTKPQ
ncbi:YfkD family protein [Halalkalibacterium halodurans]|uniref:BH0888 protein n=1 Tax=Halalkalibacterium halodurans (strain ATCC BAA-125 / DSM 18197 / FERM 7344 / JCM 9153 / C-125) TaxID=272558 RepID=Q9KEG4_HALH5|nr:YfkD famly protein [Halalkalibacterium halodurans]MED4171562.1 YfkD family protein [Halalkalibacterium halodurans]BAB04607.1 BH0888 [Halalkalibacterium halodurans C-125]